MPNTTDRNGSNVPTTITAPMEHDDTADTYRDKQIGVLMAHMRHTAAQVAEITVTQRRLDGHMGQLAGEMREIGRALREHVQQSAARAANIEAKVDANTAITEDIARLKTTGRTLKSIIVWLGGLGAGIVGLWQLVTLFRGPPGGGAAP
jgi:chromosome segregation ATPase